LRPTFAEIDLSAIAANIQNIKKKVSPAQVMVAMKADAFICRASGFGKEFKSNIC